MTPGCHLSSPTRRYMGHTTTHGIVTFRDSDLGLSSYYVVVSFHIDHTRQV